MGKLGPTARKKIAQMPFLQRQEIAGLRSQASGRLKKSERDADLEREKATSMGAHTLDDFLALLKRRYGNTLRAWKECLDTDGSGSLSFMEFCAACRRVGFAGKVKALWNELDQDGTGLITLDEIDREAATLLDSFRQFLMQQGGILKGWQNVLDKDNSGQVTKDEFLKACADHNFRDAPKALFEHLDYDYSGFITLEEIDEDAYNAQARGEEELQERDTTDLGKMPFLERQFASTQCVRLQALGKKQRDDAQKKARDKLVKDMAATSLEDLRECWRKRYGNLWRAWVVAIERKVGRRPDAALPFRDVASAAQRGGFVGDYRALWKALVGAETFCTFRHIDPELHTLLEAFEKRLERKGGTLERAWNDLLDIEHNGKLPARSNIGMYS
jgi:Ca2+-binding EF-hand superfamily protein